VVVETVLRRWESPGRHDDQSFSRVSSFLY
jgi:hypothetical protein